MRTWLLVWLCCCAGSVRIPATRAVTITDRGAEPRQLLRLAPTPGATERAELTFKQRMRTAYTNTVLEDGRRDVDLPSVRVVGAIAVSDVQASGDAKLAFTVESAQVLDDVVETGAKTNLDATVERLAGTTTSWRRAATGRVDGVTAGEPIADAVEVLSHEFPDEAVGIGASWRVTDDFTASGIRWRATTTHRVRDLTATTATIDSDTELVAPEQALTVEPNASVRVTSASGHATGHAVIPLRGAVATVTAQSTLEVNLLITRGRLRISATQTIETLYSLRPAATAD